MSYSVFIKLICYTKIMKIEKICFKNIEYSIDTNKMFYYANLVMQVKSSEKSIFKILKRRNLLDKTFLKEISIDKMLV